MASQAEVIAFLETEYPGSDFQVEAVDQRSCRVRYGVVEEDLRKPPARTSLQTAGSSRLAGCWWLAT